MKILIILYLLVYSDLFSQIDTSEYFIDINSNFDSSLVYIDNELIGYTPLKNYKLNGGNYFIEVKLNNQKRDWDIQEKDFRINLISDTILTVNFKHYYYINSSPSNASVFLQNLIIGETPLRYYSDEKLSGNFILKRDGFQDLDIEINSNSNEYFGILKLKNLSQTNEDIIYNKKTSFKSPRNYTIITLLSAAILGTGYSAYRTKSVSNELYDNYLKYGYENDLERSDRQNIYFYLSLGLMQAALGGLIYFLFIK